MRRRRVSARVSTTGDRDGEITETGDVPAAISSCPPGAIRQRPPAYSAVKVGGRRAYELARAGQTVEMAEREIEVYGFERDLARRRPARLCHRVLVGNLRAQPDRGPR